MKVFAHNFNPHSNSGPNKFTRSLFEQLIKKQGFSFTSQDESDVEFCLIQQTVMKKKPMILRLDGIYFNSEQDYEKQNAPIKFAYDNADAVVFQSNFNKSLTERWFGEHPNSHVIHNAYFGEKVKDENFKKIFGSREIWSCASSWRPHKRLIENVKYYLNCAPDNSVFIVAGTGYSEEEKKEIQNLISQNKLYQEKNRQVYLVGNLDYHLLRQLYDASSTFVHLAYLDHCPNVVVDAYAHGCQIVCSNSGGTQEIGEGFKVVLEKGSPWDFSPIELYNPPEISLNRKISFAGENDAKERAKNCLSKYEEIFRSLI